MEERPASQNISGSVRELFTSFSDLIRSEINLAKAEMKHNAQDIGKQLVKVAVFGVIAGLSILPFIAFLVVGLGELLNHNYWLSSLIVSVVFLAVGGGVAFYAYKKIEWDTTLSRFKRSIDRDKDVLSRHIEAVTEARKFRNDLVVPSSAANQKPPLLQTGDAGIQTKRNIA